MQVLHITFERLEPGYAGRYRHYEGNRFVFSKRGSDDITFSFFVVVIVLHY